MLKHKEKNFEDTLKFADVKTVLFSAGISAS